jgi:hypothetical protein
MDNYLAPDLDPCYGSLVLAGEQCDVRNRGCQIYLMIAGAMSTTIGVVQDGTHTERHISWKTRGFKADLMISAAMSTTCTFNEPHPHD